MTYRIVNTATRQTVAAGLSLSEVRHFLRSADFRAVFILE